MATFQPLIFFCFGIFTSGFNPEIQMPYKAISGSSTAEIGMIGSSLRCNEQRNSLKECATECYNRSLNTGCPGFYTDTTQNGICHLCHPSSSATSFSKDDVLYVLRTKRAVPEVSMDFENYTSDTIYGTGTEGTIVRLTESDHVTGIREMGLRVHGNGYVRLLGSGNECWTNLDNCTSGMTVSVWFRTHRLDTDYIFSSGSGSQQGFTFILFKQGHTKFLVNRETPGGSWSLNGNHMSLNEWHLLTGTFSGESVAKVHFYTDGVQRAAQNSDGGGSSITEVDYNAHIGVRDQKPYIYFYINCIVDEMKYYYRVLNSAEVWREYVGYGLDLNLPSVVLASDPVSNGSDYMEIIDGNLATCVQPNMTSCDMEMKMKIWNSASSKTNYTVTVVTENLECRPPGLLVYGGQDIPDYLTSGITNNRMHFLGNRKLLILESSVTNSNDQKECIFRHLYRMFQMKVPGKSAKFSSTKKSTQREIPTPFGPSVTHFTWLLMEELT